MAGAQVVPNASRVEGKLLAIEPEPDGVGSIWKIAVERAYDVEGLPNFAQSYAGSTIEVYVRPRLKSGLRAGERLRARVTYRGDERGGRFALAADDVTPAPPVS